MAAATTTNQGPRKNTITRRKVAPIKGRPKTAAAKPVPAGQYICNNCITVKNLDYDATAPEPGERCLHLMPGDMFNVPNDLDHEAAAKQFAAGCIRPVTEEDLAERID